MHEGQFRHPRQGIFIGVTARPALVREGHARRRRRIGIEFKRRHPLTGLGLDKAAVLGPAGRGALEVLHEDKGAHVAGLHCQIVVEIGVNLIALEQVQRGGVAATATVAARAPADRLAGLGIVLRLAEGAVQGIMQARQGAITVGPLGRQDVDDAVPDLFLLGQGHTRQLAVQALIGVLALPCPAVVVLGQRPPAAEHAALDPVDRGKSVFVGQRHGQPDRTLDGVFQVLVGRPKRRITPAQFQLGEEVTPERRSPKGANAALLGVEFGTRQIGRTGTGIGCVSTPEEGRGPLATGRHRQQSQNQQHGHSRDGDRAGAAPHAPVPAVVAHIPPTPCRTRRPHDVNLFPIRRIGPVNFAIWLTRPTPYRCRTVTTLCPG